MTTQWLNNAHAKHAWSKVLKLWVTLEKSFWATSQEGYKESTFLKKIQIIFELMFWLYGEKDATIVWISWISIMAEIVEWGLIFN